MSDAWGILDGYWSVDGTWVPTSDETRTALLGAMGAEGDQPPPAREPLWCVRVGGSHPLLGPCQVLLDDGTDLGVVTALPPDLPVGYHRLAPLDGGPITRLVAAPASCHLPEGLRLWGWAVQLYAVRSRQGLGIGDLRDLATLCSWTRELGGGFVLTNPLHAQAPTPDQQDSPYYASSRRFIDTLAIATAPAGDRDPSGTGRLIDRRSVYRARVAALEDQFRRERVDTEAALDTFVAERGSSLHDYATYCILVERYGTRWPSWPERYRHPRRPAVAAIATVHADRHRFWMWTQWLADRQLADVARTGVRWIGDLAVGFDPDGADAWAFQDVLAPGVRVGSPPDAFAVQGQDWGLPPFVPWKLREQGYEPMVETLRAAFRHAGGLRIDHVMGLSRQFWIPPGAPATEGTYVRFPLDDLLHVLAIESHRAGAVVIGEDLGTVEEGLREQLASWNVLSTRLVWFESDPPSRFPSTSLAGVTTHDLPTIAGVWSANDLVDQRRAGVEADGGARAWFRSRLSRRATLRDTIVATHADLAAGPAMLVAATLDDALAVEERPNLPGTVDERPNWRLALPLPLEAIQDDPGVLAVAHAMAAGRAQPSKAPTAAAV